MDDIFWNKRRPLEIRVRVAGQRGFEKGTTEKQAQRDGRVAADFGLVIRGLAGGDGTVLSVAMLTPSGDPSQMTTEQLFHLWVCLTGFIARRPVHTENDCADTMDAAQKIKMLQSFLGMMGLTPELGPLFNPGVDAECSPNPDEPPPPSGEEASSTD